MRGAYRSVLREGRPRCAPGGPPAGGARGAPGAAPEIGGSGVEAGVSGEVGVGRQGMRSAGAGSGEARAWMGFLFSTRQWGLRLPRACPPTVKLSISPGLAGPPWASPPLCSVTPALPLLSAGKLRSHGNHPPSHVVPAAEAPVLPAAVWPWHAAHPWNPSPLEGCVLPPWCPEVWAPMTGCSHCPLSLRWPWAEKGGFVPHEGPGDGVQPGPLRGGHRVQCYMAQPLDFVGAPTGPVDS